MSKAKKRTVVPKDPAAASCAQDSASEAQSSDHGVAWQRSSEWVTIQEVTEPRVEQDGPIGPRFTYVDISSVDNDSKRIVEARELPIADAPSRAKQRLRAGDVIVSMTRPNLNAVALVPFALDGAIGSTGFHVLRAKGVEQKWLYYSVQWGEFVESMSALVQGALYPAVRPKDVKAFRIPVPPVAEQRRIIALLEENLSGLESAAASLHRCQANIRRLRNATRHEAVVGALVSATSRGEPWPVHSLGDLATVGTGATPLRSEAAYHEGGTIPWVTSGAVNASLITAPTGFVTERALRETNLTIYPPGTLLVAMYGEGRTRGKCAELGISATTNQALAAVQLRDADETSKDWIKLVLDASYAEMRRAASGGVQPNLNLGIIRRIPVPMPSVEVRASLLEAVRARLDAADRLDAALELQLLRALRLRRALIHAAFTGDLVSATRAELATQDRAIETGLVGSVPARHGNFSHTRNASKKPRSSHTSTSK